MHEAVDTVLRVSLLDAWGSWYCIESITTGCMRQWILYWEYHYWMHEAVIHCLMHPVVVLSIQYLLPHASSSDTLNTVFRILYWEYHYWMHEAVDTVLRVSLLDAWGNGYCIESITTGCMRQWILYWEYHYWMHEAVDTVASCIQ
jgi:hypothetical protein